MADDYDALLTALQQIEEEARSLRSVLQAGGSDRSQRDEALIRATRRWMNFQWAPPGAVPPGPGSGGSTGSQATCPKCGQTITLT